MGDRTLVCILSETRANTITWPSFKKNVLDELNADLAVCIGVRDNYDRSNEFWQHAKYRFTSREYDDWSEALDFIQRKILGEQGPHPDWRKLMAIPGNWLGGMLAREGSAAISMYFRWLLLQSLRDEGLLREYDRFVVTRSDFVWECPHPPMEALDDRFLWTPDGEHYHGLMDRHAVLTPNNIDAYLNNIETILVAPDRLLEEMRQKHEWNFESYLLLEVARRGFQDTLRYFPYILYAGRARDTATRWSQGAWSDELGYYVKYPTEHLRVERYKKFFTTKQDWLDYFRPDQKELALNRMLQTPAGDVVFFNNGKLSAKPYEQVLPWRHGLRVDVEKGALSPFFTDTELDFAAMFPHFARLSIPYPRPSDTVEIRTPSGQYLAVDENKDIVSSPTPAVFTIVQR